MEELEIESDAPHIDGVDFPLVSIHAANELARVAKNLETDLENAKELSNWMLSKPFTERLDYNLTFSKAYHATYPEKDYNEIENNSKKYVLKVYQKLISPNEIEKDEIKDLIKFCVSLSDYSAIREEHLRNLRGPCF